MKVYLVEYGVGDEWDEIGGIFSTMEKAKEWSQRNAADNPESDGPLGWKDYTRGGVTRSGALDYNRRYSVLEVELDAS